MDAWKFLLGILTLAASVWAWYVKKSNDRQKEKEETDAEIDKADNATSLLRLFDKLRRK